MSPIKPLSNIAAQGGTAKIQFKYWGIKLGGSNPSTQLGLHALITEESASRYLLSLKAD